MVQPISRVLYHRMFVHADTEWYDTFDRYIGGPELLECVRGILPATWSFERAGIWVRCSPPDPKLPEQGWKIHVSATRLNCDSILARVANVAKHREVSFKFVVDRDLVELQSSKGWSRASSGKFITIYPPDEDLFREVIEELYVALKGKDGPYVLSDRRYKDSKVLYYRYGEITARTVISLDGTERHVIETPEGVLVTEQRVPYYDPPDWVIDPFDEVDNDDMEDDDAVLKDGRYQIERAIRFSVTGGVYLATDLDSGKTVVIKEARPFTGVDEFGVDACDRLRKEYRLLEKLRALRITPEPIDLFTEWEHLYLVEEFVPGPTLVDVITSASSFMVPYATPGHKDTYLFFLINMWRSLARALLAAYKAGVCIADLSTTNVIVTDLGSGEVRLVDLEAAWEPGVDQPGRLQTPGFSPPNGTRSLEDLVYAFGALMWSCQMPTNTLLSIVVTPVLSTL